VSPGYRAEHARVPWDVISGLASRVQPDLFEQDVRTAWEIATGPLAAYVDALDAVVPEGFGEAPTDTEEQERTDREAVRRLVDARLNVPDEKLAALCRRYRIKRLRVFGSVLRDDFGPDSDVDVLVDFEPGIRVGREIFDLQEEMSAMVGGRDVDVMRPDSLDRYVRSRVLSTAREIYVA
jgi:predicted nucleotidyltransferase